MQAHYAEAISLEMLKAEMNRITRAISATEQEVAFANAEPADVEKILEQALIVASSCYQQYKAAPPFVRQQINQGSFEKLWIGQDGTVEEAELIEPFWSLLTCETWTSVSPGTDTSENRRHPDEDNDSQGSHNNFLVELRGFEPLTP